MARSIAAEATRSPHVLRRVLTQWSGIGKATIRKRSKLRIPCSINPISNRSRTATNNLRARQKRARKGSFWMSIHVDGNLIWEGSGSARGEPTCNARAHAYGYLASVTFISRTVEFYGAYAAPRTTVRIASDSKSWQSRKAWFFDVLLDRPTDYSYPDHDVTLQIEAIVKALKPQINVTDVLVPGYKSREAKKGPPAQFPLIHRATDLADLQLDQLARSTPTNSASGMQSVPTIRWNVLDGQQNSNFSRSAARKQLTVKQYVKKRHCWTQQTLELVNLDEYATARQSNRRLQRYTTRFAHACCRLESKARDEKRRRRQMLLVSPNGDPGPYSNAPTNPLGKKISWSASRPIYRTTIPTRPSRKKYSNASTLGCTNPLVLARANNGGSAHIS
jgi:hypothetical protein